MEANTSSIHLLDLNKTEDLIENDEKPARESEEEDGPSPRRASSTLDPDPYGIEVYANCGYYFPPKDTKDTNGPCQICNIPGFLHLNGIISRKREKINTERKKTQTDAYGIFKFRSNNNRAKYVKVCDSTPVQNLFRYIQEKWLKLDPASSLAECLPNIFISITGGAKDFKTSDKIKEPIKQGLRMIANSSKVWIITGGTDAGVMKFVGDIFEGEFFPSVTLFGVATWGIVNSRKSLLLTNKTRNIARYPDDEDEDYDINVMKSSTQEDMREKGNYLFKEKSRGSYLNSNHTHFILVDSGKDGAYGGEIKYRADIERFFMKIMMEAANESWKKSSRTMKRTSVANNNTFAPAVQIVVEGGPNTIQQVRDGLYKGTTDKNTKVSPIMPIIIIEGSGRASDLLAYAYPLRLFDISFSLGSALDDSPRMASVADDTLLRLKIENIFPGLSRPNLLQIYNDVRMIMRKKKYITIFSSDGKESLEEVILKALMRAHANENESFGSQNMKKELQSSKVAQLNLALSWNKVDIGKEIFKDLLDNVEALDDVMFNALLENKYEFVELLLDNGFKMNSFLNHSKLGELYYKAYYQEECFLKVVLDSYDLQCKNEPVEPDKIKLSLIQNAVTELIGIDVLKSYTVPEGSNKTNDFQYPFSEIFIWAVLCNKHELALCFFKHGEECIIKALMGRLLNLKMSYKYQWHYHAEYGANEKVYKKLDANAEEFGQRAVLVLDEYASKNKKSATEFVTMTLRRWGNHDCMSISIACQLEEFIAHDICQDIISTRWRSGIGFQGKREHVQTLLGIWIFPLLHKRIKFEKSERYVPRHRRSASRSQSQRRTNDTDLTSDTVETSDRSPEDQKKCLPKAFGHALLFYRAPVTRFWTYFISYIVFLGLFSYIVTQKLEKTPTHIELIVTIYVFSLAVEEFRQVCHSRHCISFREKVKRWWSDHWNKYDFLAILVFIIGFILRMEGSTDCRSVGHVFYIFDNLLWMLRLLDVLTVSPKLGPYVVMVQRMMKQLFYFGVIFMVFFLSYGVAKYSLLQPESNISHYWAMEMFGIPYFEMYGELFLQTPPSSANQTVFDTNRVNSYGEPLAIFLLATYLILTNILLINLLIAIFNNTYSIVKANSNRIWKYQRYLLVEEFASRPSLPPPLIIFQHFYIFLEWLWNLRKTHANGSATDADDENEQTYRLEKIEKECVTSIVKRENILKFESSAKKFKNMDDRLTKIQQMLEDTMQENRDLKAKISETAHTTDSRLSRIEHNVKSSNKQDNLVHTPLNTAIKENPKIWKDMQARDLSPCNIDQTDSSKRKKVHSVDDTNEPYFGTYQEPPKRSTLLRLSTFEKNHVLARSILYPLSDIERFRIPEQFVPWKVEFAEYKPRSFIADCVDDNVDIDRNLNDKKISEEFQPCFNAMDGKIDRRSHEEGGYIIGVDDGLPRNPCGRTGIEGRGLLRRYGPNHIAEAIFVRNADVEFRNKLQVLVRQKALGEYEIPADELKSGEQLPENLRKLFCGSNLNKIGVDVKASSSFSASFKSILKCGVSIFAGYLDDIKNTDNSWLETKVTYYKLPVGDHYFQKFMIYDEQLSEESKLHLKWIDLGENTPLINKHQLLYLQKVAEIEKAHFSDH